jgi:N6-L-threonylcarbamoyladenine synthase
MEKLISTSDDAIGEFFDKVGRIMNLPFPAGPYIEKYGENALPLEISIPKSLSFSGLKTKFTNLYENGVSREIICKTMEVTSANLLIHHIKKYIKNDEKLIVGGGVSANEYIRNVLKTHFNVDFIEKKLCTDNGVMIAFTGYLEKI